MNRIGIEIKDDKMNLFPIEKKKAENEKIPHLTVFNMILVDDNKTILFRLSKKCDFKNFWTFVAGHIESMEEGKNPLLSILRETKEEIGFELKKEELFILGENELKNAKDYQIIKEDLISEAKICRESGLNSEPPHMVLPFISILKKVKGIDLGNEFDRFEIVKLEEMDRYKLTPVTKTMIERFLKLRTFSII